MKIRNVSLFNSPHATRDFCSWTGCTDVANHHATFEHRTKKLGWIARLMGFCDKHRGAFRKKFNIGKRGEMLNEQE